jgi:hypothetical protein
MGPGRAVNAGLDTHAPALLSAGHNLFMISSRTTRSLSGLALVVVVVVAVTGAPRGV